MNNKPTLTIGIPAYNEEGNIVFLLESLISQKQNNFTLKEIIIISDGSTDTTVKKIQTLRLKNKIFKKMIKLLVKKRRLGKSFRLNQIHLRNSCDFLLILDADILPSSANFINLLFYKFKYQKTWVVAGNKVPLPPKTFVEKIVYTQEKLWYNVRIRYKSGNNIYNNSGSATLIKSPFEKKIVYPDGTVSDQQYLYLKALEVNGFAFSKKAAIYFALPKTVKDYFLQNKRLLLEKDQIAEFFNYSLKKEYFLPKKYKLQAVVKSFLKNPLFTFLGILFDLLAKVLSLKESTTYKNNLWESVYSTKELHR